MTRTYFTFLLVLACISIVSCNTTRQPFFGKRTPHEAYTDGLRNAGLLHTRLGTLWQQVADYSLQQPVTVSLPYAETGYFAMDQPTAMGYTLTAKQGDKLLIDVHTKPAAGFLLFVELWQALPGRAPKLLRAADTLVPKLEYAVETTGNYIVRLQPELLQSVSYRITITTGPSLAYPVGLVNHPRIISFWGAGRDAGARKHEGIDILVKKHTPALAVAPGTITNAGENNLGGKVVFLQPDDSRFSAYYAHLDTQWVQAGQHVHTGDTLGLTGNTGNARHTVSHLHFGIYTGSGAVDPLPFVNQDRPLAKETRSDTGLLGTFVRLRGKGDTIAKIIAATDDRYRVQLPDRQQLFVSSKSIGIDPLRSQKIIGSMPLLDLPDSNAAVKTTVLPGSTVAVMGTFNHYEYVEWQHQSGWLKK